ncbi:MAG: cytochrome c biosis protein CcmG, thiol:disulfide interchange protein DsbE [Thermomicrobiales bacterium]|nr:cytochrome c biosis protein CcmG, thiol:disulfide interchange protein DsbE [Thermomicrobiales bacterium]
MTNDSASPPDLEESTPETADAPLHEHGRIGYGRYARYTPLGLAALMVIVLLAIGVAQRRPSGGNDQVGRLVGQPAPDVTLELLGGDTLRLTDLRGSVVAVNFWAAWCAPCKSELPRFQAIADEATRNGESVKVVGVGIKNDYVENARTLVADLGLTFPTGRDTAGDDPMRGQIEKAFGISNYPTTVFIRPDGTIAAVHIGELDEGQIREYINQSAE